MQELTPMRRIAARLEPGGRCLILLYHRIDRPATDPWRLAVSPDHFAEQMEVLRSEGYEPVPLADLVRALRAGRPVSRAVAVTFDDGYADNLHHGLPVLERLGIPATVYVTAGDQVQTREFWWKQLEGLFLEPGLLPPTVEVGDAGFSWTWSFNGSSTWTPQQAGAHRQWCAADAGPAPSPRHEAFRSLLSALEPMPPDRRDVVLARLHDAADADPRPRASHLLMDAAQLQRLTASGLVEVGAHTLTHPHLSALPLGEQRTEIAGSKARLEDILDRPVTTFAYPFGTHRDFDAGTVRLVKEAGFASAAAVCDRAVSRSSDPYELPRVGVIDWNGEEFAQRLHRWLRRWP